MRKILLLTLILFYAVALAFSQQTIRISPTDAAIQYIGRFDFFEKEKPVAETELEYTNPYELLVAVILSAQCTDKRVNLTTPRFFERFTDAERLALAKPEEVFQLIKSISYPNNKHL